MTYQISHASPGSPVHLAACINNKAVTLTCRTICSRFEPPADWIPRDGSFLPNRERILIPDLDAETIIIHGRCSFQIAKISSTVPSLFNNLALQASASVWQAVPADELLSREIITCCVIRRSRRYLSMSAFFWIERTFFK